MFLVPVVLFLLDVIVLVLANSANDNLAKSACRAAASAVDSNNNGTMNVAATAAQSVCTSFNCSSIIKDPQGKGTGPGTAMLTGFYYAAPNNPGSGPYSWPGTLPQGATAFPQPATGQVGVVTSILVQLPVPFPGFSSFPFVASDVEPIVSINP
jgi:hypothetical protein